MVVIRLARAGAKKKPFYHVVVADKRFSRDGRFIEKVGYFNPVARAQAVRLELQRERIEHWVKQGAQASERVAQLIKMYDKSPEEAAKPKEIKKPVAKVKAKVEEKAEAKEEPKTEAKAEAKEEPKAEAKDEAKDKPKAEAKDEAKDKPKAEAKDEKSDS